MDKQMMREVVSKKIKKLMKEGKKKEQTVAMALEMAKMQKEKMK